MWLVIRHCKGRVQGTIGHLGKTYGNKEGYAYHEGEPSQLGKRVTLQVTVMLDPVPGAFHEVEDHVNHMMQTNPYIQTIEVKEG